MHYEEFEWRLFREGSLSTKMKAEMMDHLRTCDTCLTSYLAATEGQPSEQVAARANSVRAEKSKV